MMLVFWMTVFIATMANGCFKFDETKECPCAPLSVLSEDHYSLVWEVLNKTDNLPYYSRVASPINRYISDDCEYVYECDFSTSEGIRVYKFPQSTDYVAITKLPARARVRVTNAKCFGNTWFGEPANDTWQGIQEACFSRISHFENITELIDIS